MKVVELKVKAGASKEDILKAVSEAIGEEIENSCESCNHEGEFTITAKAKGEGCEVSQEVSGCTGTLLSVAVEAFSHFVASLNGVDNETLDQFSERLNERSKEILEKGE